MWERRGTSGRSEALGVGGGGGARRTSRPSSPGPATPPLKAPAFGASRVHSMAKIACPPLPSVG